MNPDTGEIRKFETLDEAFKKGFIIPVNGLPKKSCRKCHGRGYIGKNDQGKYVPCSCVRY